jgi:hypothetical protein
MSVVDGFTAGALPPLAGAFPNAVVWLGLPAITAPNQTVTVTVTATVTADAANTTLYSFAAAGDMGSLSFVAATSECPYTPTGLEVLKGMASCAATTVSTTSTGTTTTTEPSGTTTTEPTVTTEPTSTTEVTVITDPIDSSTTTTVAGSLPQTGGQVGDTIMFAIVALAAGLIIVGIAANHRRTTKTSA